ncbi:MAG: DUF2442 domain-containing protein [Deltaproteobacteria bacterium]|nr:DUF2442 domain-containing protein [Deltaproteobacteria bacterium]
MSLHINHVRYLGDFCLRLWFNDGQVKDVDLKDDLYGEVFEPLQNQEFFQQVKVNPETKTVEWPNGADFAPEYLSEIGQTIKKMA